MAQAEGTNTSNSRTVQPIPRYGRGLSAQRRARMVPTLADDWLTDRPAARDDPDLEAHTWPDFTDQSRIPDYALGRWHEDDTELDDGM